MMSSNLFQEILIKPPHNGANTLYIVSGYATSAMTFHHIQKLHSKKIHINVHLIVGMTAQSGLSQVNHRGFQKLVQHDFAGSFECSYIRTPPPVHSKLYAWFNDNHPVTGFMGSANYSQRAFGNAQRELMIPCSAADGFDYFQSLAGDTISCTSPDADKFIQAFKSRYDARQQRKTQPLDDSSVDTKLADDDPDHVCVSFISSRYNDVAPRSSLNWGHRFEYKRERNQAYIPLKAKVYNSDFFPLPPQHFTVHTDDNDTLICRRAQQSAKAIETPHNNSLLGRYFRKRLGLSDGQFVTKEDLLRYGRTDVDFYKVDDENYLMDFSPPQDG